MNAFEHFGLPMHYHLDADVLRKRYLALATSLHPDRNQGLAESLAEQRSATNNQAYATLRDPEQRLRALLHAYGALDADPEASPTQLPGEFLMEALELNEALQDASTPEEHAAAQQSIATLKTDLDHALETLTLEADQHGYTPDRLEGLKLLYHKRRYALRLAEQARTFAEGGR